MGTFRVPMRYLRDTSGVPSGYLTDTLGVSYGCHIGSNGTVVFSSRPSLTQQKPIPIPIQAKHFFGIFDTVSTFCENNSFRLGIQ